VVIDCGKAEAISVDKFSLSEYGCCISLICCPVIPQTVCGENENNPGEAYNRIPGTNDSMGIFTEVQKSTVAAPRAPGEKRAPDSEIIHRIINHDITIQGGSCARMQPFAIQHIVGGEGCAYPDGLCCDCKKNVRRRLSGSPCSYHLLSKM
jgi:hypothetical protein